MAFHHRKLQPKSVSKNTTMDCSKCCSPTSNRDKDCQLFCNTSLPGVCIPPQSPDYPPRPPPCPPLADTDYQSKQNHEITQNFIHIFCIIGGVFLLGCCCMVIFKCYSKWNNSRRRNAPIFDDTHEDFLDENRSPVVDHPIWFITTLGLQQSVIDSITVCKYKRDEALIEGTECSVCLNEFQEDESLRLLPKCSHAFHLPCIDTWLRSHKNCPLCRAPIVRDAAGGHVSVTEPSLNDSGSREEIWLENMENYGGLGSHQVGEGGTSEVSVGADNFGALPSEDGTISDILKKGLSYSNARSCELRVLSDLADNRRVAEEEVQPVRRSVSMDLSSASMIYLAMANVVPVEHEGSSDTQLVQVKKSNSEIVAKRRNGNSGIYKLMKSSSFGLSLQKGPISMKRSFSSGGKFLLSRHSRSKNSIIPLCS